MPFSEQHEAFDPHIDRLFENHSEAEIRQFLHRITLPLLDKYERFFPEEISAALREKRWEGLSVACENAREDLDWRAVDAEENGATNEELTAYTLAGIVLEMMGYLDAAALTPNTVFEFIYCLNMFQTRDSIANLLAANSQ